MSAVGLATDAVNQLQAQRRLVAAVAAAAAAGAPPPTPPAPPPTAASLDSALSTLATYIPAEAIALYLAVTSSLPQITNDCPWINPLSVFWLFTLVVSPGLFVLAYFAKLARNNEPIPDRKDFPWFRLGSSILAFCVWALCIPGNPFSNADKPGLGILYGLIAVGLAIVLPSVEAIYQWIRSR